MRRAQVVWINEQTESQGKEPPVSMPEAMAYVDRMRQLYPHMRYEVVELKGAE